MDIHMLVAHRNERYTGEFGPEVCVAWDEYCVEENPEGFRAEVDAYQAKYPTSDALGNYAAYAEVTIEVDVEKIMDAIYPTRNPISAKVKGA